MDTGPIGPLGWEPQNDMGAAQEKKKKKKKKKRKKERKKKELIKGIQFKMDKAFGLDSFPKKI